MLDIAFELIGEATSNSLLMFCFCNLIIVMIFTGSSKPGSTDSQEPTFVSPVSFNMRNVAYPNDHDCDDNDKEVTVSSAEDELLINDSTVSDEDEDRVSSHCSDDDNENDYEEDDDVYDESEVEEEEEDDVHDETEVEGEEEDGVHDETEVEGEEEDDDLRKRVEEFIAKINNEWRHEKQLRALNLVY